MNGEDALKLSSNDNFIKTSINFEKDLKLRLKWSKKEWARKGEVGTRIHKLSNSLNFWKHKLKPALEDVSLLFTLYNPERDEKVPLIDIINEIESISSDIQVKGVSNFRNPRYICLYFKNKETCDKVKENFKIINENFVVHMSWAFSEGPDYSTLNVHWLPMTADIENIKKELNKYVECVEEQRKSIMFMSGRNMLSGNISFKVKINKDIKAENIPHLMNIANMEVLITMNDRQPLCLNCNELGHISRECKLRFCYHCNELKHKTHDCGEKLNRTYANVAKHKTDLEDVEPDDWGVEIVRDEKSELKSPKELIAEKITELEGKVEILKQGEGGQASSCLVSLGEAAAVFSGTPLELVSDESQLDSMEEEDEGEENLLHDEARSLGQEDIVTGFLEEFTGQNLRKSRKKNNRKKKDKIVSTKVLKQVKINADMLEGVNTNINLRSYGKPIRNARKIKENAEWEKMMGKNEFKFDD